MLGHRHARIARRNGDVRCKIATGAFADDGDVRRIAAKRARIGQHHL